MTKATINRGAPHDSAYLGAHALSRLWICCQPPEVAIRLCWLQKCHLTTSVMYNWQAAFRVRGFPFFSAHSLQRQNYYPRSRQEREESAREREMRRQINFLLMSGNIFYNGFLFVQRFSSALLSMQWHTGSANKRAALFFSINLPSAHTQTESFLLSAPNSLANQSG